MVIVVTGGIGSGKSQVCRILEQEFSCTVYEADSKAKELYVKYPQLLDSIEESLRMTLRDENGKFMPGHLAQRIFSDKDALQMVEQKLFPYLKADFEMFRENVSGPVVFESATVLEKPCFDGFGDKVILVDAPYEVRMNRACSRDGSTEDAVRARMAKQKLMNSFSDGSIYGFPQDSPEAKVLDRVDAVLINDGSKEKLLDDTRHLMQTMLNKN